MSLLERLRAIFTINRRQSIYAAVAVIVPLLVNLGVITEGVGGQILALLGGALALLAAILQLVNFSPAGVASWFLNVGRAALYAAAGVVVPALVFFGVISQDLGVAALAQISTVLASLAALVGIFFSIPVVEPAIEEPALE
ncbi:hypothetical protein [Agromyces larvae]|uniref:Holin n=1 Tax=Agromyces larvae TaxID=2929802 RepID=A0ABY4C3D3_9MICO|nr:hypothetical protein [Agromyces larvae]UOE45900.1 hypothetical protein MTO99_09215 [Agromyces larvae]